MSCINWWKLSSNLEELYVFLVNSLEDADITELIKI